MRVVLALVLAAWFTVPARSEPVHLVVGFQSAADYLPAYVADTRGIFARHGLSVTLQPVPNGGQIPAALLSDSIQIGTLTIVLLVQAASQGLPISCLAGASTTHRGTRVGVAVMPPGSALRTQADFAGHSVGVSALGSLFHVLFVEWLNQGGADAGRVHFVEAPFAQLGDLLRSRRVDAALLVEPFASRALSTLPGSTALDYMATYPDGLVIGGWCAKREWAATHADAVASFRAAMAETLAAIGADEGRARQELSAWLKLPPDIAQGLPLPHYALELRPADIAAWTAIVRKQGLIDRELDPALLVLP